MNEERQSINPSKLGVTPTIILWPNRDHRCPVLPGGNSQESIENDAGNVFVVKENQPRLLEAIQGLFDDPHEMRWVDCDYERTVDGDHGRIENRKCWTTSDSEHLAYIASFADWPGPQSTRMIEAKRRTKEGTTVKRRYFISSLAGNAKRLLHAVRAY